MAIHELPLQKNYGICRAVPPRPGEHMGSPLQKTGWKEGKMVANLRTLLIRP